ncbi:MAG: hypothetical protein BGO07_04875 [Alphaproteobacteria bacterium 40-19]|nr:MAG: hypothetical protein BGO07_04875 [Alphaproteobacteria bacterium 40-19]
MAIKPENVRALNWPKWIPLFATEDFQSQVQQAETMLKKINKNLESEYPFECNRSLTKKLCAYYISEKNFPEATKILEKIDKAKEQKTVEKQN